ncbi:MAG: hypothetical protein QNJ00_11325 [Woeseiaceae bacterium]|nr:hypothetical protein [Woeseiaceae bacterium]
MSMDTLTTFFGWTVVINVAVLAFSAIGVIATRGFISRIHGRMFGLESADLSRAYFQYLAQYKIAVIVFSLVPYISLKLMA